MTEILNEINNVFQHSSHHITFISVTILSVTSICIELRNIMKLSATVYELFHMIKTKKLKNQNCYRTSLNTTIVQDVQFVDYT